MKTKFRSFQLAKTLYKQSTQLKLPGHISNQLQRASSSVALNLAEGRGRASRADQLRFFHIALGSVRECQAILELHGERVPKETLDLADHLGAAVYNLVRKAM